jgi:hypothetical protein
MYRSFIYLSFFLKTKQKVELSKFATVHAKIERDFQIYSGKDIKSLKYLCRILYTVGSTLTQT